MMAPRSVATGGNLRSYNNELMALPNLFWLSDFPSPTVIVSLASGADTSPAAERRQIRQKARGILLKRAQSALRLQHTSVPKTAEGAPVWPKGQRGSFSHWDDISLCLLCASAQFDWGVDIEGHTDHETAVDICAEALGVSERTLLKGELSQQAPLIFSAKESFYKASAPQVGRVFGYDAIRFCGATTPYTLCFELVDDLSSHLKAGQKVTIAYRQFAQFTITWTALHTPSANAAINCPSAL